MSPHNITTDDFMQLDRKALAFALRLFQQELDGTLTLLATDETARKSEHVLDELCTVLQLRKVFRARLEVLEEEEGVLTEVSVAERYHANALQPTLV
jgi:hypothetical protein